MGRRSRYSPEVKERAVRMVFEHEREYSSQWGAVTSIAAKIGCSAHLQLAVSPREDSLLFAEYQPLQVELMIAENFC